MEKTSRVYNELSWDELSPKIEILFGVFRGRHEHMWLQRAWRAIGNSGLTVYKDEYDRQLVMVRLMVLATIYREFCSLAFNVHFFREEKTLEWIEERVVNRMRLWEMIHTKLNVIYDEREDLDYLLVSHVCILVDGLRGEIFQALLNSYHHNKLDLFDDMFRIGYNLEEKSEVPPDEDDYFEDYLNRAQRTLSWIIFGMPRIRPIG